MRHTSRCDSISTSSMIQPARSLWVWIWLSLSSVYLHTKIKNNKKRKLKKSYKYKDQVLLQYENDISTPPSYINKNDLTLKDWAILVPKETGGGHQVPPPHPRDLGRGSPQILHARKALRKLQTCIVWISKNIHCLYLINQLLIIYV